MTDPTDDLVWHYTSLNTLAAILSTGTLRATEVRFQNDPMEHELAQREFRAALDEVTASGHSAATTVKSYWQDPTRNPFRSDNTYRLTRDSRYVLCGSTRDNFFAWRTYGSVGSVGCAIGLDRGAALRLKNLKKAPQRSWQPVSYIDQAARRDLRQQLKQILNTHITNSTQSGEDNDPSGDLIVAMDNLWLNFQAQAKHPSYTLEQESRVTVEKPPRKRVKFADGISGPRPYVELTGKNDRLPIREVMLAPGAPTDSEQSLRWILAFNKYPFEPTENYLGGTDEARNTVDDRVYDGSRTVRVSHSQHQYRAMS